MFNKNLILLILFISNIAYAQVNPTNGATAANQVSQTTILSSINAKTPSFGQATSANSSPVVLSSNQSAIVVSSDMTKVGGAALSLGQSTMANGIPIAIPSNQSAFVVSGDITKVGGAAVSLGQKTSANSFPVVLGSDQSPINVAITAVSSTNPVTTSGTVSGLNPAASISSLPITGIDSGNSSTATLGGNATFTGTYYDAAKYTNVTVNVSTDVTSAVDGLKLQYSSDGVNLDSQDVYTIPAGGGKQYSAAIGTRYFRVVYTNGAGAQSAFRLQTKYHNAGIKPSSVRLADNQTDQDDVPIGKAVAAYMNGTSTANVSSSNPLPVSQTNILPNFVTTATVSAPNAAATTFVAKISNANRKGLEIMNTTNANCWFAKATTVTSTTSTVYLLANSGYYNMPYPIYTGQIQGICNTAITTGAITVTEY